MYFILEAFYINSKCFFLRNSVRTQNFFSKSFVFPRLLIILVAPFEFFEKILEDIRYLKCTTEVTDTGGTLNTVVVDTVAN